MTAYNNTKNEHKNYITTIGDRKFGVKDRDIEQTRKGTRNIQRIPLQNSYKNESRWNTPNINHYSK